MTINRVQHDKSNPYTLINTSIVRDTRISGLAKALWLYAFSRRDDWQFYTSEMRKHFKEGRDAIRSALNELEKYGYLEREQKRDDKNRLLGFSWVWHEISQIISPKPEKPAPEFPAPEIPPLSSIEGSSIEGESKEEEYEGAAPAAPCMAAAMPPRALRVSALPRSRRGAGEEPRSVGGSGRGSRPSVVAAEEKEAAVRGSEASVASGGPKRVRDRLAVPENAIERAPNVYTTPEQHEKLICSPATPETIARAYQRLSEWKEQSPRAKWKRNDYLSIVRWVLDALKEEDLRKSKFSNGGCYRKSRADPNASPEQRAIYDALCPA